MEGLSPADNEIYLEFVAGIIIQPHHFWLPVHIYFFPHIR